MADPEITDSPEDPGEDININTIVYDAKSFIL